MKIEEIFKRIVTAFLYASIGIICFFAWAFFAPVMLSVGVFLFFYGLYKKLDNGILYGMILIILGAFGIIIKNWLHIF